MKRTNGLQKRKKIMSKYTFDGIEYPSVTTILDILDKSGALMPWAVNNTIEYLKTNPGQYEQARIEYRNVSKEALNIGSQVHDLIECYIKHGKDKSYMTKYNDSVQNAFLAFLEWEEKHNVEWLETEQSIYHPSRGYAGTLDFIAKIDDHIYCGDFKTSKAIYPEYYMQIAAYNHARIACNGIKVKLHYQFDNNEYDKEITYKEYNIQKQCIIRLDKTTGDFEFKDCTEKTDRQYIAFCHLVNFYYAFKKRKLKNNPFVSGKEVK
jgi:hypothetical protein